MSEAVETDTGTPTSIFPTQELEVVILARPDLGPERREHFPGITTWRPRCNFRDTLCGPHAGVVWSFGIPQQDADWASYNNRRLPKACDDTCRVHTIDFGTIGENKAQTRSLSYDRHVDDQPDAQKEHGKPHNLTTMALASDSELAPSTWRSAAGVPRLRAVRNACIGVPRRLLRMQCQCVECLQ